MDEHPNVARAKDAIATFNRGDLDAYMNFFSEDVLWHVAGNHPLSGDYRGTPALLDYFVRARELTGGSLQVQPEEYLADDEHLGIFARVYGQRGEKNLDVVLAQAFRVDPQGRWSEYWAFADDQNAVNAFWADDASATPAVAARRAPASHTDAQRAPARAYGDMTQHPHAQAARRAFEAFNERNFRAMADLLAADAVVYTSVGALPTTYGRDEYFGMIEFADKLSGGTQRIDPETVLATDRYMMCFMRGRAQRPGKSQDVVFVLGAKLNPESKWAELWYWTDDIAAVNAFWSD